MDLQCDISFIHGNTYLIFAFKQSRKGENILFRFVLFFCGGVVNNEFDISRTVAGRRLYFYQAFIASI